MRQISDVTCKGCGLRLGACATGVITAGHFGGKQILAKIEGLLEDAKPPLAAV